jgi:hypothetical protein
MSTPVLNVALGALLLTLKVARLREYWRILVQVCCGFGLDSLCSGRIDDTKTGGILVVNALGASGEP